MLMFVSVSKDGMERNGMVRKILYRRAKPQPVASAYLDGLSRSRER